jgi:hypothetical protein
MLSRTTTLRLFAGLTAISTLAVSAFAVDTVNRKDGTKPAGTISTVSPTEVVVTQKIGNKETKIPANEIDLIDWDGEPAKLGLARNTESGSAYLDAKPEFEEILKGDLKPNVKTDVEFYLARIAYKEALGDPALAKDAVKKLADFATLRKTSYRLYQAQSLLGEIALISGDFAAADKAYDALGKAPWPETQLAARIGSARVLLAKKDAAGAKKIFDEVAKTEAKTPAETSQQLEGMLGQAECLMGESKHADAIKILEQVIDKSAPTDTRLQALAYIRQGDCLKATDANSKDAAIAYLHVDLLPNLAAHKDLHAEALFNLAGLWTTLGQPERAERAQSKLKDEYPNSDWTKKLGSG